MEQLNIDIEYFKKKLLARKKELENFVENAKEGTKPVELDQQSVGRLSRMEAMQEQAMAQEVEQRRKSEILRIDAALKRIDEGDYGYCIQCDEEIAPKRLELDPSVSTCVACAS